MTPETRPAELQSPTREAGSAAEVLLVFLRLGCASFGGPIAHLGYFQRELVERRCWCTAAVFAEMVGLAQSLPGPASSQTGFALGILRAGWPGGLAAWVGFTLPSALLMLALALGHGFLAGPIGTAIVHGLQLVAIAVVAQSVWSMQRTLAPDRLRFAFALAAIALTLLGPPHFETLLAILAGAVGGLLWLKPSAPSPDQADLPLRLPKPMAMLCAGLFGLLLLLAELPLPTQPARGFAVFAAFYRAGAFVFGGGHVVLPLLETAVVQPGWVSQPAFLAGYGTAQALPGPLFAFAAYLGAVTNPSSPSLSFGLLGLLGIFAPGLLAMAAVLPFWSRLRQQSSIRAALTGINAAVVGVLAATLYRPLCTSTLHHALDVVAVLLAFCLLTVAKVQPWLVVFVAVVIAAVAHQI